MDRYGRDFADEQVMRAAIDVRWDAAKRSLRIPSDARAIVLSDARRRMFVRRHVLYKVALAQAQDDPDRRNGVSSEHDFLVKLDGIHGIPRAKGYETSAEGGALAMDLIDGRPLAEKPRHLLSDATVFLRLVGILWRCSFRGVAHNDLRAENVIVGANSECYLIDFDQATFCSVPQALLSNLFGVADQPGAIKVSLMKTAAKRMLPRWLVSLFLRAKARSQRSRMRQPIVLPSDASSDLKLMADAWTLARTSSANAPGQDVAYYSLVHKGVLFPGERPWRERWEVLRSLQDYRGKRVLELGCNMGLLSCALLESGAAAALGVDHDDTILRSAATYAQARKVAPTLRQIDFDKTPAWEEDLAAFAPDVVFALNVLNWVQDKDRFLRFLSRWPVVIIEGHDSYETEAARMAIFANFRCELVSISERGRPLMVCYRQ